MNLDDFTRKYRKYMSGAMPRNDCVDILKKNITLNGVETEWVIIMEELSELIQEVSKHYRGKGCSMHLLEEMADVYICLDELKLITGIDDRDIMAAVSVKMDRIKKRYSEIEDARDCSGLLDD